MNVKKIAASCPGDKTNKKKTKEVSYQKLMAIKQLLLLLFIYKIHLFKKGTYMLMMW
jgi:hypothetical protein